MYDANIFFFGLCRVNRSDKDVRGVVVFDSTSTVTLSPTNFQYGPTSIIVRHDFWIMLCKLYKK
jgi:hypothetical protein